MKHNYIRLFEQYKISDNTDKVFEILKRDCLDFLYFLKDCYTNNNIAKDYFFYRGLKNNKTEPIIKKKSRKDRKPKDTNDLISKEIDELFYDQYKIRPRSSGIFTIPNSYSASLYGSIFGGIFSFFPIGKYDYIWSEFIKDLFDHLKDDQFFKFDEYVTHDGLYEEYSWYYYFTNERSKRNYINTLALDMIAKDYPDREVSDIDSSEFKKYLKESEEELEETMNKIKNDSMEYIINSYFVNKRLCDALKHNSEVIFISDEYYLVNINEIDEDKLIGLIENL